jgi:hypothetical protein
LEPSRFWPWRRSSRAIGIRRENDWADWDNPLLRETISPQQIQVQWGEYLAKLTPDAVDRARVNLKEMGATNALRLRAAGMKIVLGSDVGQSRFFIGWMGQLEMENWVWMGLTPKQAIVAATRDSAAVGGFNTGSTCGVRKWIGLECEQGGRLIGGVHRGGKRRVANPPDPERVPLPSCPTVHRSADRGFVKFRDRVGEFLVRRGGFAAE